VSSRSGKIIPIPSLAKQTYDYKTPNTYKGLYAIIMKLIILFSIFRIRLISILFDYFRDLLIK